MLEEAAPGDAITPQLEGGPWALRAARRVGPFHGARRPPGERTSFHESCCPERESLHQQLPKVELHLHLEGAPFRPKRSLGVFRRHGNTEMACLEDVLRLYQHRDFYDFLAHFRTIRSGCAMPMTWSRLPTTSSPTWRGRTSAMPK